MSADNWTTCPNCRTVGSFREDWEIYGAHTGVVEIVYSGSCRKCPTSLKVEQAHPIAPVPGVEPYSEYADAYRKAMP